MRESDGQSSSNLPIPNSIGMTHRACSCVSGRHASAPFVIFPYVHTLCIISSFASSIVLLSSCSYWVARHCRWVWVGPKMKVGLRRRGGWETPRKREAPESGKRREIWRRKSAESDAQPRFSTLHDHLSNHIAHTALAAMKTQTAILLCMLLAFAAGASFEIVRVCFRP